MSEDQLELDLGDQPTPMWAKDVQRLCQCVNAIDTHLINADHGAAREAIRALMDHAWTMFGRTYVEYRHPVLAPKVPPS